MAEYPTWQSETIDTKRSGSDGKGARQRAEEVKEETVNRGKGIIEGQKRTASDTVHRIASALENVASDLDYDQPQVASIFRDGGQALDKFSRTLRERDTDSLMQQAQEFARRQPALVLGGTIAAGFLLSRLLKSSPQEASETNEYPGFAEEVIRSERATVQTDSSATSGREGLAPAKEEKIYGSE